MAHEVNNPVGISLTVASSLAAPLRNIRQRDTRRYDTALEIRGIHKLNRDSAQLLVTNLLRAGELIQSFKQVAVDRSVADRREFDLCEATNSDRRQPAAGAQESADYIGRRLRQRAF